MDTPVFSHPSHMLAGVFADLHVGDVLPRGLRRTPSTKTIGGETCVEVTYGFYFDTPLVHGGRISVEASAGFFPGVADAERDAALSLVSLIRSRYQLFPADYSFVHIIEKRALFLKMKSCLLESRRTYAEIHLAANQAQSALVKLHEELGKWVLSNSGIVTSSDIYAVSGMASVLADRAKGLASSIKHAGDVVQMSLKTDKAPDEMSTFERTVPANHQVVWERSFNTLRCVYQEALKKLPGPATDFHVDKLDDGKMVASIYLPGPPFSFMAAPGLTKAEAKARLCFQVINFVEKELHLPILDFNYPVKRYQDALIEQFDTKMDCIWGCAQKVNDMIYDSKELIGKCAEVATPRMSVCGQCDHVFFILLTNSLKMDKAIIEMNTAMSSLEKLKVDRAGLEVGATGNAA